MTRNRPHRRTNSITIALSLHAWSTRLIFAGMVSLALLLLLLNHSGHPAAAAIRSSLAEIATPAVAFLSSPVQTVSAFGDQLAAWQHTVEQNRQLAADNEQLKRWRLLATRLEAENTALRDLLNLAPAGQTHYLTARVLTPAASPYSRSYFLQAGSTEGVIKDMPVINGEGLVGRVIEPGEKQSRLLLLTDINSRISVVTAHGRDRAIAAGLNGPLLELRYLPEKAPIAVGEPILTSGDSGLLPANVPVGTVTRIEKDRIYIEPAVNWTRLDYVSLIVPAH